MLSISLSCLGCSFPMCAYVSKRARSYVDLGTILLNGITNIMLSHLTEKNIWIRSQYICSRNIRSKVVVKQYDNTCFFFLFLFYLFFYQYSN